MNERDEMATAPDHQPPLASNVLPFPSFEEEPPRGSDLITDLTEIFGEPEELFPGFFIFTLE